MEKNNIIFIIIFVVLVYIIYRLPSMEQMTNVDKATEDKIREIYKIDTDAIRNLSNLAKDLTVNNKLRVPGGLDLDGPFNIIPKGVIVAWNGKDTPTGWALCNGENGTPDLRGRFIRMWNDVGFKQDHGWHGGATNSTVRIQGVQPQDSLRSGSRGLNHGYIMKHHFNDMGGTDVYNLQVVEMPAHNHTGNGTTSTNGEHTHTFNARIRGNENGPNRWTLAHDNNHRWTTNPSGAHNHTFSFTTSNTGNGWGHGVSNPYYVLTYIMKL
jgi:microcystin-dependent protein